MCLNCRVSIIFSLCFITHKLHLPFTGDDGGGGGCGYDGLVVAMLTDVAESFSAQTYSFCFSFHFYQIFNSSVKPLCFYLLKKAQTCILARKVRET